MDSRKSQLQKKLEAINSRMLKLEKEVEALQKMEDELILSVIARK